MGGAGGGGGGIRKGSSPYYTTTDISTIPPSPALSREQARQGEDQRESRMAERNTEKREQTEHDKSRGKRDVGLPWEIPVGDGRSGQAGRMGTQTQDRMGGNVGSPCLAGQIVAAGCISRKILK